MRNFIAWQLIFLSEQSLNSIYKNPQERKKQIDRRETDRLPASFNISLPWSYFIWYLFIFFFFFLSPKTLIHCKRFAYLNVNRLTTSVSCEWLLNQLVSRFSYFLLVFSFHFWEFPKLWYLQLSCLNVTVLIQDCMTHHYLCRVPGASEVFCCACVLTVQCVLRNFRKPCGVTFSLAVFARRFPKRW